MVKKLITKDMLLDDIVIKYPETAVILMGYGLHCIGCIISGFETLEQGAKTHGLTEEEIKLMLKDVNTIALENINKN